MKLLTLVPPALCLCGAALLVSPLWPSRAFSKTGESLSENQRDFRVFDNFADATANDNVTPAAMFPGQVGAELALWKAPVEWGSTLHGDGSGDPVGGNLLGSGGANFDAFWGGTATGIGNSNGNIASALADCGGGGTLAFTELPAFDGWRIRFCDEWDWDDGPGAAAFGTVDLQGVMTHEYGHALGLGHSTVPGATMTPATGGTATSLRSIAADDIAGIQCVYGVADPAKPTITATVADTGAGTITIYGTNFGATDNEVWFTNAAPSAPGGDPKVTVTGLASMSGGTVLPLAIPAGAGPGDVLVNVSGTGGETLSNAYPTDLAGTFGTPPGPRPDIASVSPTTIEALIPGTAETVTFTGTNLNLATAVLLDGLTIDPARYTVVGPSTITLDMPQADSLGLHELAVTDGTITDVFPVTIVAVPAARLEWGSGDPLNVVDRDDGLDMILAGAVGELHAVRGSPSGPPAQPTLARLAPPGQVLVDAGSFVIPAQGWIAVHLGNLPDPMVVGSTWSGKSFVIAQPRPFAESNDQSITLVP